MKRLLLLCIALGVATVTGATKTAAMASKPTSVTEQSAQNETTASQVERQPVRTITRAQAVQDIDSAVVYITTIHPNPFTVISREKWERQIRKIKRELPKTITLLDFYLRLAPAVTALGDGHTSLATSRAAVEFEKWLPAPLKVDPYTFEMSVEGHKIVKINGIKSDKIIDKTLSFFSGERLGIRVLRATYYGWSAIIPRLYPAEKYVVKFADGTTKTFALTDKPLATPTRPQRPNYTIRFDGGAAIFEYNDMVGGQEQFAKYLADMFAEIRRRGIENLIVDLRNNGGGSSNMGDELLKYISPVPFAQFGASSMRIGRLTRPRLFEQFNVPELSTLTPDQKAQLEPFMRDTVIAFPHSAALTEPHTDSMRFHGKVYLLTSINTFSSASSLTWAAQYFKAATIVGSDTGGLVVCFGDLLLPPRLPNSGIEIAVSWKEFYLWGATDEDRHPVHPDIAVPPDEALDYVLKLIGTK